jgi:glycosyltransferase involved in cell wall biosynthesis
MAPLASIVIPVGPAHVDHVATALASCSWQTMPDWEAIVVNDSSQSLPIAQSDKVRLIDVSYVADGLRRSSVARNVGIAAAQGVFTVFLDADDYLLPQGLETLLRGHCTHSQAYTYSGHYGLRRNGEWAAYRSPEYDQQTLAKFNIHPITALVPTSLLRDVGGFDEGTPGLEDWTLWLRLAQAGHCGERVHGASFVYRRDEGVNHIPDIAGGRALMDAILDRYRNTEGRIDFMGCGCGKNAQAARAAAKAAVGRMGALPMSENDGLVTLEFTGRGDGKQHFAIPAKYGGGSVAAGRGPAVRFVRVTLEQAEYLIGLGFFQRAVPVAPFVPPPTVVAPNTEAESVAPAEPLLAEQPVRQKARKATA